jgi:O-antigen ligase
LFEANSRGPLIGFFLALVWYFASSVRRLSAISPLLIFIPFVSAVSIPAIQNTLETLQGGWQIDPSSLGRLELQKLAIEDFLQEPLLGMHYLNPANGPHGYPHNILIESAMALGVIGALLLASLFVIAGTKILGYFGRQHALLSMLFLQQMVNSQLSGAIWNSSAFFMLLGIILSSQPPLRKMVGTRLSVRAPLYPGGRRAKM